MINKSKQINKYKKQTDLRVKNVIKKKLII